MKLFQHVLDVLETNAAQNAGKVYTPDEWRFYSQLGGNPEISVVDEEYLLSVRFELDGKVAEATMVNRDEILDNPNARWHDVHPDMYNDFCAYVTSVCVRLKEAY